MSDYLRDILESAGRMEMTGVVDASILPTIDSLAQHFHELKESLIRDTTRRSSEVFYQFYAARNAESMLQKMRERYEDSLRTGFDNPVVAADTLKLVPFFVDLFDALEKAQAELTEANKQNLLLRVRKLRLKAAETKFLPTVQEELRGLDMTAFADKTKKLAEIVSSIS